MTAAMLAAVAALLLIGAPPHARLVARRRTRGARRPLPWRVLPAAALLVGVVALLAPGALWWILAAAISGGTCAILVRGHRARRAELRLAKECARAARVLASLMAVGKIPTAALLDAAEDCPVLGQAAQAVRLGGDVAGELDRASGRRGLEPLRSIGAAWRLAERTGAPMAAILARVADDLRRRQQLDALIEAELAAARASGHIMAALPFLAVGLGFAVGVNSLRFLTGDPLGRVLLVVGVSMTAAGVLWIDALARPRRKR
ncbi:hypothetical protein BW730_17740 [Tessaracoccus aquimaris]|uniref:Type II secretion system protein GspF domain-containing protein n=1 Tax=Tessaracoccus aquimaris TaxID=1332264 RepID=A0A1Q2CSI4_9ACTN|nr:type II secretion system F family protein [Tessaracoccus aquimaris]AQP49061.1 hypothetical protein BW730_17740 [Tessaracoccus aquimaris]